MINHTLPFLQLIEMNCLGLYWNTSGVSSFASPDLTTEQMIVSSCIYSYPLYTK